MLESRSLNPPVVNAILVPNKCQAQHQSQSETWLEVEVSQRGKFYPQVYLDECLYELQMLEYDRIDILGGIDISKTNASKERKICHYWYFKDISFKYQRCLCSGCHGLIQKAISFNDVAVVYVKENAYRIHFGI